MKKYFLIFSIISCIYAQAQQITPSEKETKDVIQQFRKSTVSFGIVGNNKFKNSEGQIINKKIFTPIGAGVCFYFYVDSVFIPCFITAKHVLYNKENGKIWKPDTINVRFSDADTLPIDSFFGTSISLYENNLPNWIAHPDSTVDLACIILDPSLKWPIKEFPLLPYWTLADDEDYFEGKEIYVLGYPGFINFDLLNKAFLRKGIIASVPSNYPSRDKKILIDCNIFPGNSGGPVFSVSHNSGQILSDTVLQKQRFYGIVSERRFSENNVYFSNGSEIVGSDGKPIVSLESTAVGVIITAKKVKELLSFAKQEMSKYLRK